MPGYIVTAAIPQLPGSLYKINVANSTEAENRRSELENFVRQLVALPEAINNRYILSFLGALKDDMSQQLKVKSRSTVHVAHINECTDWGDLILFRSSNSLSGLQRMATGSEWDHVGLVVRYRRCLQLLESTVEGVTLNPLAARIQAYAHYQVAQYMVLRKYSGPRTAHQLEALVKFCEASVGTPYGFNFTKLLSGLRLSMKQLPVTSVADEKKEGSDDQTVFAQLQSKPQSHSKLPPSSSATAKAKSFFCSELVAAALIIVGLIPDSLNPSSFWPGSFSIKKDLDKICPGYGEFFLSFLINSI